MGFARVPCQLGEVWSSINQRQLGAICDNPETGETARAILIEFSRLLFLSRLMAVCRRCLACITWPTQRLLPDLGDARRSATQSMIV